MTTQTYSRSNLTRFEATDAPHALGALHVSVTQLPASATKLVTY